MKRSYNMTQTDIAPMLQASRKASRELLTLSQEKVSRMLFDMANALEAATPRILKANRDDLSRMDLNDPKYDRLQLNESRVASIASDMRTVANLPSPLSEVLEERVRPNGLKLRKISVPFGVVGVIYEARPNVSCDVAALCLRSGNACVLKGGHEAALTNEVLVEVMRDAIMRHGVDENIIILLPPSREATAQLLEARSMVDLLIPRGSSGLINFVRDNAKVPVIETGAGVCHVFMDRSADRVMTAEIVNNSKTRRVSVCNALDCLVVDSSRLVDLPEVCRPLVDKNVVIWADERSHAALAGIYPDELLRHVSSDSFGTEFLSYAMAVKTVDSFEEAVEHISRYGSGHSEAIVTADAQAGMRFQQLVDAACVYVNAPTSWTDGSQFGLGAEIGISTQKLHARGPMALRELTTYKWLINGEGQLRP